MNVFLKVTLKSPVEGYVYTFGAPLGMTGPGVHAITPRTLEKLSTSVDNIKVLEQDVVLLQFTMANPVLYGIKPPGGNLSTSSPCVMVQLNISVHSGIPNYQLYNKTWVVTSIQIASAPIPDAIRI